MDQGIKDIDIVMEAMFEEMGMGLLGEGRGVEVGGGFEEEREGVLTRREGGVEHVGVEEEGARGGWGGGEGADEGVEGEGVWGREGEEEGESEVVMAVEGVEGEEAGGSEGVVEDAGPHDHLGVDLGHLTEGPAAVGHLGQGQLTTSSSPYIPHFFHETKMVDATFV